MRIIQLIDSLEAGGAERMAVNYANALLTEIAFSGLVVTRKEGSIFKELNASVPHLLLNKKHSLDFRALYRFRQFIITNRVTFIHAHSTSFFFAVLVKLSIPRLKIIWHNHFGNSESLSIKSILILKILRVFCCGSISVSHSLQNWAVQQLSFKKVICLPNFPSIEVSIPPTTILNGVQGKRIVVLANLRVEKNHFLILDVAKKLKISYPNWSFHFVGTALDDSYSKTIFNVIKQFDLKNYVFVYGSKSDIKNILDQAEIGVLASKFEGLPLALLEYGLCKKAVISTNVGDIPSVIKQGENGFLFKSDDPDNFYKYLVNLIEDENLRERFGNELYKKIISDYSQKAVISDYLKWLSKF